MLTIGLLNNMPDAAMQPVERQLCSLLANASGSLMIGLKLFAPLDARRSPAAQLHVERFYEPFAALEETRLDALIVTGMEPLARWLEDEPAWPVISRLADHAERTETPVLWSCMAAHVAAYRLAGVHRRRMPDKLSGLYLCRPETRTRCLPRSWLQPHSRFYGLERQALLKAGFRIVSASSEAGPDMFTLRRNAEHLFLQGHPEYGLFTLLGEFRRDVERFLCGASAFYPNPPRGYYGRAMLGKLAAFEATARRERSQALMQRFDAIACDIAAEYTWRPAALQIYGGWLQRVAKLQARRRAAPARSLAGLSLASLAARSKHAAARSACSS